MPYKNVLQVKSLNKSFINIKAVDNISFSLEEGDIFAFLGPNGAGKTTTLRILLDIIKADSGSIRWGLNGKESLLPPADQIGYLPEERGLYLDVPIIRSLVYLASIRGMQPSQAKTTAMEWLEKLGLADRAKEKLQVLSKGNQQKIQFVAAILHKPAFAILDEPFSGLDPLNQEIFIDYIKELNQQGTTVLLSSHQMSLVEKIAKKLFLIDNGRELFNSTITDIYKSFGSQHILEIKFASQIPYDQLQRLGNTESISTEESQQVKLILRPGTALNEVLKKLAGIEGLTHIQSHNPNLHDIFINLVRMQKS